MNALCALQKLAERNRFGIHPGLASIQAVLARMGNPERDLATVHLAGTNGKGATAAMVEAVLSAAGYRVGRYTSPHLCRINERFHLGGGEVADEALEAAASEALEAVEAVERAEDLRITFFEGLTATAFALFRRSGIRLAVMETGLGGRLDATNVVMPLVSVLTRIGLDHCDWLGKTIPEIAKEKAGIVKTGRPVVCGLMPEEARAVIASAASSLASPLVFAEEETTIRSSKRSLRGQVLKITTQSRTLPPISFPLAGAFQVENAMTAVTALEVVASCGIPIPDEAFVSGLSNVTWPGRFQLLRENPPLIVDGAHNPEGARALVDALASCGIRGKVAFIAGFCGDKDVLAHLRVMMSVTEKAWAVEIPNPRSLSAAETAGVMRMAGMESVEVASSLSAAVESATTWAASAGGVVVICGSLFLAGEALSLLHPSFCGERRDPSERL